MLKTTNLPHQNPLKQCRDCTKERTCIELVSIDEAGRELWAQWEKLKDDYKRISNKRKGKPVESGSNEMQIQIVEREIQEPEMRCLGDVFCITEIRGYLRVLPCEAG
jgi:hypothetical protein